MLFKLNLCQRTDNKETGRFIFQNYRQALEKLDTNAQQLSVLENRTKTSAQDYEDFLLAERAYFESRKKEPEQVSVTNDYMDLLQKLQDAVCVNKFSLHHDTDDLQPRICCREEDIRPA